MRGKRGFGECPIQRRHRMKEKFEALVEHLIGSGFFLEEAIELLEKTLIERAPVLIRRALGPDATEADVERALEFFLNYYHHHMLDYTTLYPGVRESLTRMAAAGKRLAVLTNKPVRMSREIVHGLALGDLFFQ